MFQRIDRLGHWKRPEVVDHRGVTGPTRPINRLPDIPTIYLSASTLSLTPVTPTSLPPPLNINLFETNRREYTDLLQHYTLALSYSCSPQSSSIVSSLSHSIRYLHPPPFLPFVTHVFHLPTEQRHRAARKRRWHTGTAEQTDGTQEAIVSAADGRFERKGGPHRDFITVPEINEREDSSKLVILAYVVSDACYLNHQVGSIFNYLIHHRHPSVP